MYSLGNTIGVDNRIMPPSPAYAGRGRGAGSINRQQIQQQLLKAPQVGVFQYLRELRYSLLS